MLLSIRTLLITQMRSLRHTPIECLLYVLHQTGQQIDVLVHTVAGAHLEQVSGSRHIVFVGIAGQLRTGIAIAFLGELLKDLYTDTI